MKNIIKYIIICFIFSCAVQSPPTGGPKDIEGPYIVSVKPFSGLNNIDYNTTVEILFNEMVDPNSVKSSITLNPITDVLINSYANKIRIRPKKQWPEGEFNIKLKRSIADYSNNIMNSSIQLNYSTTNNISNGIIKGKLFNIDNANYGIIGLYELIQDSLILYKSIENDNMNNFEFNNIKNGEFIVVALIGEIDNIYTDYQFYPYGLYNELIILNESNQLVENINIYIDKPNKFEKISSVNMINQHYGEIILSNDEKLFLIEKDKFNSTQLDDSYISFDSSLDSLEISYKAKNTISEYIIGDTFKLNKSKIDSIPPTIVDTYFEDSYIIIRYSEPVQIQSQNSFIYINDKNDSLYLPYIYINPNTISVKPSISKPKPDGSFATLSFEAMNKIKIDNQSIVDLNNNVLVDSTINVKRINKRKGSSNIYGTILYDGENDIIVEIFNSEINAKVEVDESNNFIFENIYPSSYYIWAYEDINTVSDSYFNGTLYPLKLGADFGIYNDIIEIRKNWDVEGIKIIIGDYN